MGSELAAALARMRWSKTTEAERKEVSRKLHEAKRRKRGGKRCTGRKK